MVMATKLGEVKKTPLKNFANVRRDGLIAMDLEPADELVSANLATDEDTAIVVSARDSPSASPSSSCALPHASPAACAASGSPPATASSAWRSRTPKITCSSSVSSASASVRRVEEYPLHGRGGQGVSTFKTNPKTRRAHRCPRGRPGPRADAHLRRRHRLAHAGRAHLPPAAARRRASPSMMSEGDRVAAVAVIDMDREYDTPPDALPTGATAAGEQLTLEPSAKRRPGTRPRRLSASPQPARNRALRLPPNPR